MLTLTQAHKADNALLQTKLTEYKAYLKENGATLGTEGLKTAKTLKGELDAIKARIEGHVELAGLGDAAEGYDSFLNGAGNLGSFHSGKDVIDPATKSAVYSQGAGLFGQKTWDGIQDPHYKRAFGAYLKGGEKTDKHSLKILEIGIDSQGGYLAPPEFLDRVISRKPTPTRLTGMVDSMPVGRDRIEMPRVNYQGASDDPNAQIYTTGFRVTNTEENPSSDTQANVNDFNMFGKVGIDNYTHMFEGVMTNSQIEDPAFDALSWYEGKLDETNDIFGDDKIVNGLGVQESTGILTYALNATNSVPLKVIPTATAGVISPDDLIGMSCDVSEQYEDQLRFVLSKTQGYQYLRKLKDTTGRYIFGKGFQDNGLANGKPADIAGYPYVFTALMKAQMTNGAFTTGQTPIIFGDLKGYVRTPRLGFSVQVCRELLVRRNQVLIIGRLRLGGTVVEPWRLRVLKVA